jgi:hypothetical protein
LDQNSKTKATEGTMSWLMSFKKLEEPHARLFCFPHAGGGAQSYKDWSGKFPNVEVQAINLPGRGSRQLEEPITHLPELVRAIVSEIRYQLNLPYAFFGHSWGSVLAYEVQVRRFDRSLRCLKVADVLCYVMLCLYSLSCSDRACRKHLCSLPRLTALPTKAVLKLPSGHTISTTRNS